MFYQYIVPNYFCYLSNTYFYIILLLFGLIYLYSVPHHLTTVITLLLKLLYLIIIELSTMSMVSNSLWFQNMYVDSNLQAIFINLC